MLNDFVVYIFDYLFSWLCLDICMWVLGATGLISIILFLRFLFNGGFNKW